MSVHPERGRGGSWRRLEASGGHLHPVAVVVVGHGVRQARHIDARHGGHTIGQIRPLAKHAESFAVVERACWNTFKNLASLLGGVVDSVHRAAR